MTNTGRRLARLLAATCALSMSGAVGFAQSTSAAEATNGLDRSSVGIAREYVATEADSSDHAVLPPNVVVPAMYRPLLESMLRRSPTFRRQCLRIANDQQVFVRLQIFPGSLSGPGRAVTRFVRRPDRTLWAAVEFNSGADLIELIAHEFEHVLEQLDEIDLAGKAALARSGVHTVDSKPVVFETIRAQKVGLRVAHEVRTDPRRAD